MASHVTQSKSQSLHKGLKDLPISVPYLISYHLISDLITYLFPPCSLCSRHIGLLASPQSPTILPPQDICLCCSLCVECSSPRCLCLVCPLNNFSSFSGVTLTGVPPPTTLHNIVILVHPTPFASQPYYIAYPALYFYAAIIVTWLILYMFIYLFSVLSN